MPEVWLRDVTLTQDPGLTLSGACVAKGALDLRRVRVTGFRAGGVVATCLPALRLRSRRRPRAVDHADACSARSSTATTARGKGAGIATEGAGATLLVAHSRDREQRLRRRRRRHLPRRRLGHRHHPELDHQRQHHQRRRAAACWCGSPRRRTTYVQHPDQHDHEQHGRRHRRRHRVRAAAARARARRRTCRCSRASWRANFSPSNVRMEHQRRPGTARPACSTASTARSSMSRRGIRGRPTWAGARSTSATRCSGPLTPLGGAGNLPLHPLLAGSPAVDGAPGRHHARRAARRLDRRHRSGRARRTGRCSSRWSTATATARPSRDLGAYERNDRWQTELLAVRAQGPSTHTVVTIPGGYDRGAGTTYAAASATERIRDLRAAHRRSPVATT